MTTNEIKVIFDTFLMHNNEHEMSKSQSKLREP